MGSTLKGAACGIIAAVAYGTNPLFSLNLYAQGMDVESVLFYRFAIAAIVLGTVMAATGHSLAAGRRELAVLVPAGAVFAMSSQTLYQSFLYMDAGVACSILFVYPILVAVIMAVFFRERASALTYGCIAMALTGFGGSLRPLAPTAACLGNVLGVALVPTIIPILFINIAIKNVGPTYSAIIGALEPVTALAIGAAVFGELITGRIVLGASMILVAVTLIVSRPLLGRVAVRRGVHGRPNDKER